MKARKSYCGIRLLGLLALVLILIISMVPDASSSAVAIQQEDQVVVRDTEYLTYLPVLLYNYPPDPPEVPVLNEIENADGDNDYTVSWNSAANAAYYLLEEDDNADFSSPTTVYEGADTSKEISGRDIGIYYYRVKAKNSVYESGWSNIRSVEVTQALPDTPVSGPWSGITNQGRSISWTVSEDGTEVNDLTIYINWGGKCGVSYTINYLYTVSINNNKFYRSSGGTTITGTFTSSTSAEGTFTGKVQTYYPYYCTATTSGTWTASPSD